MDAILFNFISGVDIPLDTIRKVKENSKAIIFMDVHNKTFGIGKDGQRFPREWKEWREWLCYPDKGYLMTPKERAIAALALWIPDVVPTFELQFELTEELLGKRRLRTEEWKGSVDNIYSRIQAGWPEN